MAARGWRWVVLALVGVVPAAGQVQPPPPRPPVQAALPAPPPPRAPRQVEPDRKRRELELYEREVLLRRRISLLAAKADRLERRLEGLREPAAREDASVIPGGLDGLRSRLEEERTRLADLQSRLNYERTDLERQRLSPQR